MTSKSSKKRRRRWPDNVTSGGVWWCDRGWQPVKYALCLDESVWDREMKRLQLTTTVSFPTAHGCCTFLESGQQAMVMVTLGEGYKSRKPIEVAGILVHEATHVWQHITKIIGEESPSIEFEAYSIQAISQELMHAFKELTK
jgi:hypothetical protein